MFFEEYNESQDGIARDTSNIIMGQQTLQGMRSVLGAGSSATFAKGGERIVSENLHEFLSEDYLEVDMG